MMYYLIGAVLVALAVIFILRWMQRPSWITRIYYELDALRIPRPNIKYSYTTPKGARVESVVPVPSRQLELIDEGITNQIVRYRNAFPNWTKGRNVNEYNVLIVNPMATNMVNEPGSPALMVSGVQSAGTMIGITRKEQWIVVPHQSDSNWQFEDYFVKTVWHESEHYVEAINDMTVFYQFVGAGDVHPHVA